MSGVAGAATPGLPVPTMPDVFGTAMSEALGTEFPVVKGALLTSLPELIVPVTPGTIPGDVPGPLIPVAFVVPGTFGSVVPKASVPIEPVERVPMGPGVRVPMGSAILEFSDPDTPRLVARPSSASVISVPAIVVTINAASNLFMLGIHMSIKTLGETVVFFA